jgi:hypothetical protein
VIRLPPDGSRLLKKGVSVSASVSFKDTVRDKMCVKDRDRVRVRAKEPIMR